MSFDQVTEYPGGIAQGGLDSPVVAALSGTTIYVSALYFSNTHSGQFGVFVAKDGAGLELFRIPVDAGTAFKIDSFSVDGLSIEADSGPASSMFITAVYFNYS